MSERDERIEKLQELKSLNINPYPAQYKPSDLIKDIKQKYEKDPQDFAVNIAGRILLKRLFGKALFMTLEDESGSIQIFAGENDLKDQYNILKKLIDLGDIIGVKGTMFTTQKGEVTVLIKEFTVLSKAINPFPDKYHGITDVETRYRQRYADMIVNKKIRNDFILRSKMIRIIRDTLHKKDFYEVETPILQVIPGGANARPFITHHNALGMDLYLRIATELHLKRVITGGIPRVFEIGRIFRNEGISTKHNPEFTTIELYEAYGNIDSMMDITELLISEVFKQLKGSTIITYQEKEYDFTPPFKRLSMKDAVSQYAHIDLNKITTFEALQKEAILKGIKEEDTKGHSYYTLMFLLFEEFVEEKLLGPVFIIDHPHEISPLAKQKLDDPQLTERFELFIDGKEFANAFSEQNDPFVQKEQFLKQASAKDAGDHEAMFYDADYINALEYGMPPTGGLGIGIDRLAMLLIDTPTIRDVLLFPHMRPEATDPSSHS
jgi:lysyl-tRNA synthetase class 2